MFDRLFKNPKTRGRNIVLCILPFILLIAFFGFFAYKSLSTIVSSGEEENDADVYVISDMHYKLRKNATEYQVELFNELDEAIDAHDDLKTAELVAMNYVADFYTWTNKAGSYDVGGIYFVNSQQRQPIALDARMKFYKYLTYYIEKYGSDSLMEVKNISVLESRKNDEKYETNNNEYESYYVKLEWEYNDYTFDDHLGTNEDGNKIEFMNKGYFNIIKLDNGRFEIVDAWGDE